MRLTENQIQTIRQLALQIGGENSRLRVFGSRFGDHARGGDLDLMLELAEPVENPVLNAPRLAARVSRTKHGLVSTGNNLISEIGRLDVLCDGS